MSPWCVLLDEVPREVRHHLGRGVGRGDRHVLVGALDVVVLLEGEAEHLGARGRAGGDLLPERVRRRSRCSQCVAVLAVELVELRARVMRAVARRRREAEHAGAPSCSASARSARGRLGDPLGDAARAGVLPSRCGSILPNSSAAAPSSVTSLAQVLDHHAVVVASTTLARSLQQWQVAVVVIVPSPLNSVSPAAGSNGAPRHRVALVARSSFSMFSVHIQMCSTSWWP